jgi:eight-cysteine-cluster-containing protein
MDEAECWGNCIDKPDEELPPGACLEEGDCADGEECIKGMCPGAPCSPEWCPPCYGKCKTTEPIPLEIECMSSGCSGEICAAQPMISVCLWKPEFACYKLTECAANADGTCAWQENEEFLDCMKEFKDSDSKP